MIAPIMTHTADEAWRLMHNDDAEACVHLQLLPGPVKVTANPAWAQLMAMREKASATIEEKLPRETKADGKISKVNPLDVGVRAEADAAGMAMLRSFDPVDLADLHGVSRFEVTPGGTPGVTFSVVDLRGEPSCDRSWKRDGTVKQRSDGGMLSERDAAVLGVS
jgi:isoleucyl-tRNA synthetase